MAVRGRGRQGRWTHRGNQSYRGNRAISSPYPSRAAQGGRGQGGSRSQRGRGYINPWDRLINNPTTNGTAGPLEYVQSLGMTVGQGEGGLRSAAVSSWKCPVTKCKQGPQIQFPTLDLLCNHWMQNHEDTVWSFCCPVEGCERITWRSGDMCRHMGDAHGIANVEKGMIRIAYRSNPQALKQEGVLKPSKWHEWVQDETRGYCIEISQSMIRKVAKLARGPEAKGPKVTLDLPTSSQEIDLVGTRCPDYPLPRGRYLSLVIGDVPETESTLKRAIRQAEVAMDSLIAHGNILAKALERLKTEKDSLSEQS